MIKETISFRQKELDKYLISMKRLLISQKEINQQLDIYKKDLRNVEKEIVLKNKFLINNNDVK